MDIQWDKGHFPSGVFYSEDKTKEWILRHKLSGVLTEYPIDIGVYKYVGEIEFPDIAIEKLREIFKQNNNNTMYDCYPITKNQLDFFMAFLDTPLDLKEFDYFLEANSQNFQ